MENVRWPSLQEVMLYVGGSGLIGSAAVAIYAVDGQQAPVTAAMITGAALLFAGAVLPRLEDEFELTAAGLKGKLAQLNSTVVQASGEAALHSQTFVGFEKEDAPESQLRQIYAQVDQESGRPLRAMGHEGPIPDTLREKARAIRREGDMTSLGDAIDSFDIVYSMVQRGEARGGAEVREAVKTAGNLLLLVSMLADRT